MTTDDRYRLGVGKYRLGREGIRTTVTVTDRQHQMLEKLRYVKGFSASEIVQLALDSLFATPLRDIETKIQERRGRS
jgi:hypothetical protein